MMGNTPHIEMTQAENPLQEPLKILKNLLKNAYKTGNRQLLRKDCDKFYNVLGKMANSRTFLPENIGTNTPLDVTHVVTIIFYKLIAVLQPCLDRFARLREMSNIKINKLYKMVTDLYKGPHREEKRIFIESVAFGLDFTREDTDAAIREMKFLQTLISSPGQIGLIKDFPKSNVLTQRAYSMIHRLLVDEGTDQNLAKIYRKLGCSMSEEELEKVCSIEEVVDQLKRLVPQRIIKYPFCNEIIGFSCKNGLIALSEGLFSLEEGQVDLTQEDCETQSFLFFQSLAPLVATILCEMAMIYQRKSQDSDEKESPQSLPAPIFNGKIRREIERELFGDIVEKYRDCLSRMSEDMLQIFFSIESWRKPRLFDGLKDESLPPLMKRKETKPHLSRINNFLELFNEIGKEEERARLDMIESNF